MAVIVLTTCSDAFSWMEMYKFRLRFDWSVFLGVLLTDYDLVQTRRQTIIWTNDGEITSLYVSIGLIELIM